MVGILHPCQKREWKRGLANEYDVYRIYDVSSGTWKFSLIDFRSEREKEKGQFQIGRSEQHVVSEGRNVKHQTVLFVLQIFLLD